MAKVDSHWDSYKLTGFVSKPTDARPSRSMQTFFVNDRPVKSRILIAALEEAYRNQIMVGKFPACVLHLHLPADTVDVNVHPAKTEVKFLNEKAVFDCVHYGVLGALNAVQDRPQVQFKQAPIQAPVQPQKAAPKQDFFRTMTPAEFKTFSTAVQNAPQPSKAAAAATVAVIERTNVLVNEPIIRPSIQPASAKSPVPVVTSTPIPVETEPEQAVLPMPEPIPWRLVGQLYNSYILVEQGDEAYLIDQHAAHERILFDKLKENQETISSQSLITPVSCRLAPEYASALLQNQVLLEELGFRVEEFGSNALLIRQIPMDLPAEDAANALESVAADLLRGRQEDRSSVRDEILHTVACKAAIKAGWKTSEQELHKLAKTVMEREDLKHCPHGRPICITLSKKQLEKQFKRS